MFKHLFRPWLQRLVILSSLCLPLGLGLSACSENQPSQQPLSLKRLVEDSLVDGLLANDASLAVTLSRGRDLGVWTLPEGKQRFHWPATAFEHPGYQLALSGNKRFLAYAGKRQISLIDLTQGNIQLTWQVNGFNDYASISTLALNQTGIRIAIGMNEGSVILVDLTAQHFSLFKQHDTEVSFLKFGTTDDRLLSAGHDGKVLWWESASGKIIKQFSLPQRITSLAFDEAERRIFFADNLDNHQLQAFDTGEALSQLNYFERYRYFRRALFIHRGDELITATSKQGISRWQVATGKELAHWRLTPFSMGTTVLDMVSDGQRLITLSSDGALEHWRLSN
ncbi:WD40 repeat domain-containing protein [Shewanella sp. Isolate7]|uniref:WD40 repeat domain-containing protein n=1 Tax=Shewanella sp. Isolate7 TaxID=2908528 RepID=UPI001EFC566E|nr:WD40 repeat domain-containing protein [Shewanella sp. Isolate7]MCG9722572.1 WD40 repeat domain-containing protein [Shewanella sp. Isolate7]